MSIFEDGIPPVFRLVTQTAESERKDENCLTWTGPGLTELVALLSVSTVRPDGTEQKFDFAALESLDEFNRIVLQRFHKLYFEYLH